MAATSGPSEASSSSNSAQNHPLASVITQVQPGQQTARAPIQRRRPPGQKPPAARTVPKAAAAPAAVPLPVKQPEVISEKPAPSVPEPSTSTAPKSIQAPRAASPRKRKRKKPGFFASLIAFLTCSAPATALVAEEEKGTGGKTRDAPQMPQYGRKTTGSTATEMKDLTPPTSVAAGGGGMTASPTPPLTTGGSSTPTVPAEPIDAAALATQEGMANTSREGVSLPRDETADVLSGAVVPPGKEGGSGGTPGRKGKRKSRGSTPALATGEVGTEDPDVSEVSDEEEEEEYAEEDEEDRLIMQGGAGIPLDEEGNPRPLLVELTPSDEGRKCLVLDLDETLVHSSFKMIHQADFVVPVEIENQSHNVYVIKRPGVDLFLQKMGEIYEVVVFTASLSKYADPVLDHLDIHRVVKHRLFRESCYNHRGNYVKDLSQLGRPIGETIIIDNSPASYIFHPKNAVPVSSWFNDPHDTELTDLLGVLTDLAYVPDVRGVLDNYLDTETGFGLEQSMEQLSSLAQASAQEHSTLQHQQQQQA